MNFFEALSLTRRGRDVSGRGRMDGCCDVKTPVRLGTPAHASGAPRDVSGRGRMDGCCDSVRAFAACAQSVMCTFGLQRNLF